MLKVATYNIQYGARRREVFQSIGQLKEEGCQVLCLQEAHDREVGSQLGSAILRELGPGWDGVFFLGTGPALGLATFWAKDALELHALQRQKLPQLDRRPVWGRVSGQRPQERGALSVIGEAAHGPLRITNMHLDWQGGYTHRMRQVEACIKTLGERRYEGADILCGDFNTCGPAVMYRRYKKHLYPLLNTFHDAFPELSWSYDIRELDCVAWGKYQWFIRAARAAGIHYRQRLDHVFYQGLELLDAECKRWNGSDHCPLVVSFVPVQNKSL